MQALTDNATNPQKVAENVLQVTLDYLAVGIDPNLTKIVLQSKIHDVSMLYMIFSNLVSVARVERNPTVKQEIQQKGLERELPLGFFSYPVSQAADIAAFKATSVPVGQDQLPMIEITNEIVRRFNRTYNCDVLAECEALVPELGRLPGIDGKAKMSKSLGNAIYLKSEPADIKKAVKMMFTDPEDLQVSDPGKVEGNVVFAYLDAFDANKDEVAKLKEHYRRGGLGDSIVKKRLAEILESLIQPMREKRREFEKDKGEVLNIIRKGTEKAQETVASTLSEVKEAMGISYREI
jgi:tryptophanyl-tRNA synthetase